MVVNYLSFGKHESACRGDKIIAVFTFASVRTGVKSGKNPDGASQWILNISVDILLLKSVAYGPGLWYYHLQYAPHESTRYVSKNVCLAILNNLFSGLQKDLFAKKCSWTVLAFYI